MISRQIDTLVIGKGMIGAAAARYLAEAGVDVVLAGPDEPGDPATHAGVFASHYDAGRIVRRADRDPFFSVAACESLDALPALEAATGTRFLHPHPVAYVSGAAGDLVEALSAQTPCHVTSGAAPADLHLPEGSRFTLETGDAGWVDPRILVRAQTLAALAAGARVLRHPVWALRPEPRGVRAILDDATEVTAARVLVCAGAFTGITGLVEGLPLWPEGRSVLLAAVPEADGGDPTSALDVLPCMVADGLEGPMPEMYLMPPIRYPDGKRYVKIGTGQWSNSLETLEAVQHWFRDPPPEDQVRALEARLVEMLPDLEGTERRTANCVVAATTTGQPLLDWSLPGRVAHACGGNGKSAKCSDALGRRAASMILGRPIPASTDHA